MPRILIIEDDDKFREMVKKMLEGAGYNDITEAADGKIGLNLFRQNPFDLVITDLIIPDKDGIEIVIELTRDYPGVKIIAMSGGSIIAPQIYLQMAKDLGARRILAKPFSYSQLIDAVQELLSE